MINPVKSSLRNSQVTLLVTLMIVAVGVYALFEMPRREDPEITIRMGLVTAFYPGATPSQVEEQVTKKLENDIFRFAEVNKEKTYSTSEDGRVTIHVELQEWVKDPDKFWNKLRLNLQKVKATKLPSGVIGPVVNSDFGDTVALLIAIQSHHHSYAELRNYQETIEDALRTIGAVSKIERYGDQREQIYVTGDAQRLAQYKLSINQVIQVLKAQNNIYPSGSIKTGQSNVPLHTTGLYTSVKQIGDQIIGMSSKGKPIRIKDVAHVERRYEEPKSLIRVNGRKALLLSVQMQKGHNIVEFGKAVNAELQQVRSRLPLDLKISTIVNQPKMVDMRVGHFIREFFIAIIAVILVTIILLPFRIASISAMAIPVTVAFTFAVLYLFGVQLQQVSLAAMIVVLGMVVDDAIVIADNYVELLDRGLGRWDAAWQSATELAIPVLTATLTIVASFFPMAFLTGSVGEFIRSLPITVAIALSCSFVVAMLLTPLLCFYFIKKGLKATAGSGRKSIGYQVLNLMQRAYDRTIRVAMDHPVITIGIGVVSILGGVLLFMHTNRKFFPAAERNQFVIELWMPSGTNLNTTNAAVKKIETRLDGIDEITNYASFVGTSAPRFYYNFNPVPPTDNYALIIINTKTVDGAEALADSLGQKVRNWVPNGRPHVRLLQQGSVVSAPIEVRISGEDLNTLKSIGARVDSIIKGNNGSEMVTTDFHQDYYGVTIKVNDLVANQLGFSTANIAKVVAMSFSGAPVSTMWENDRAIDIVFRLKKEQRRQFSDITNLYLGSPVTGARVPLNELATLKPEWETGRIMHRNGVRTITVQSFTRDGIYPSRVLANVMPEINRLKLPEGYRITYGGEREARNNTFGEMKIALYVSLFLIFMIMLLQFRDIRETLIVMTSIPLSLLGAVLGLQITHNPFGFTAFMGLISLSGIVVRNAIILVDYTRELLESGMDIRTAAMEAGKRRLRPIFLTTMAASVGVLPMIISRSALWAPLASVLAVGLIFSMGMTLVVVPVLYVSVMRNSRRVITAAQKEGAMA